MFSAAQLLRDSGLRATPARLALLRVLERSGKPLSIQAIHRKLGSAQVDRVTVYRMTEDLKTAGLLRQVDLGHSHIHYELNDPQDHHHHLVCESCGTIEDVQLAGEEAIIQKLERRHKFQTRSHAFEMFGLCAECQ